MKGQYYCTRSKNSNANKRNLIISLVVFISVILGAWGYRTHRTIEASELAALEEQAAEASRRQEILNGQIGRLIQHLQDSGRSFLYETHNGYVYIRPTDTSGVLYKAKWGEERLTIEFSATLVAE